MVPKYNSYLSVPALLREIDAARKRLDQAHEWLRNGETSVTAAALAERTKHLCVQACQGDVPTKLQEQLLAEAKECICDLEKLLGLH